MSSSQVPQNPQNQKYFRDAGIIDVALCALDSPDKTPRLAKAVVTTIAALAKDPINHALLHQARIIDRIVNVITDFMDNEDVLSYCLKCLYILDEDMMNGIIKSMEEAGELEPNSLDGDDDDDDESAKKRVKTNETKPGVVDITHANDV
jgi:hypothetical protein